MGMGGGSEGTALYGLFLNRTMSTDNSKVRMYVSKRVHNCHVCCTKSFTIAIVYIHKEK